MKVRNLYVLLPIVMIVELALNLGSNVYVDLIFLMVVFAGIFLNLESALKFAVCAALLRSFFTEGLFLADMIIFPGFAFIGSLVSGFFYREDHFVLSLLGAGFTAVLMLAESFFFKMAHSRGIAVFSVFTNNWTMILLTAVVTPFFFHFLKKAVFVR